MPNTETDEDDDVHNYLCPVDSIERASGLVFFNNLFKNKFGKQIIRVNREPVINGKFWKSIQLFLLCAKIAAKKFWKFK